MPGTHFYLKAFSDPVYPSLSSQHTDDRAVAVVHITGALSRDDWWRGVPTQYLVEVLSALEDSEYVTSIILDWNSPGGEASAVPPLLDFLIHRRRKPILSSVAFAASAAYWLASATDAIYLQDDITAQVGSIGVMTTIEDWTKFYEQNGIVRRDIYAPQSTDKNLPWRRALQGDDTLIEQELSYVADRFIAIVRQQRPGIDPSATTGACYFAPEALRLGLSDGVVSLYELIDRQREASLLSATPIP